jgi:hypothetical protein
MKKLVLLFVAVMIFNNGYAKIIPGEHNIALYTGVGSSNFDGNFKAGESACFGVKWETPLIPKIFTKNAFFDVGIELSSFEATYKETDTKLSLIGLSVPFSLGYRIPVDDKFDIFCKAGYTFSYYLNQDWTDDLTDDGEDHSDLYASDNSTLGATVGVDIIKHIQLGVSYKFGIVKMNKSDETMTSDMKTKEILMTFAYVF